MAWGTFKVSNSSGTDNGFDPGQVPRGPLPVAPTWRLAIGAVFGGVVLLGFFAFAFLGAQSGSAKTICAAFFPLTVAFAIGTGLAGGFLGGEIGVHGRAGNAAGTGGANGQFAYAAVGGIAAVVVMLLLCSGFYQMYCSGGQ